jgi:putative FmdB family regulatory protein
MPLYEYQCPKCGKFEVIRKFADAPLTACPTCGSEIQKLASAPAIQFKGTGWYITDYAKKGSGSDGKPTDGKPSEGKTAGTSSESAPTSKESGSQDKAGASASESTKPKAAAGGSSSK